MQTDDIAKYGTKVIIDADKGGFEKVVVINVRSD